jgi:hypothetical protein
MSPFAVGMLIALLIIGFIAWNMAVARGRNKWLALVAVLFVGWATLVYYGIAGDKDSGKEWQAAAIAFGVFVGSQILLRMMFN